MSQRQTSEALASSRSRLPHGQNRRERGPTERLTPRNHQISTTGIACHNARPGSSTDDFRLPSVFPSRSAPRLAFTGRSLGSPGTPQRILCATAQILRPANTRQIRSLLFAGSRPACTSQSASQPGSPAAATWPQRCAPKRPRSAVGMARRCFDAPNALVLPDDRRTTRRGVTGEAFRVFPSKIHHIFR